jgi:hypothetical protein
MQIKNLASYQRCVRRLKENWPAFQAKRKERLAQQDRFGVAAEKFAENILEDLFTGPLDWSLSDFNNHVAYADIVLTRVGIKYLIIEVKRPGTLAWPSRAVEAAIDQALRYADEQKARTIAVSDGIMLYAADVGHGGLHDRAFVSLEALEAPECLWWLSVLGIYRPREVEEESRLRLRPEVALVEAARVEDATDGLLHPKYHLPARCFAYIGHNQHEDMETSVLSRRRKY